MDFLKVWPSLGEAMASLHEVSLKSLVLVAGPCRDGCHDAVQPPILREVFLLPGAYTAVQDAERGCEPWLLPEGYPGEHQVTHAVPRPCECIACRWWERVDA